VPPSRTLQKNATKPEKVCRTFDASIRSTISKTHSYRQDSPATSLHHVNSAAVAAASWKVPGRACPDSDDRSPRSAVLQQRQVHGQARSYPAVGASKDATATLYKAAAQQPVASKWGEFVPQSPLTSAAQCDAEDDGFATRWD
jgi:hypothetical protein